MLKFLPLILIAIFLLKGVTNYLQSYFIGYVGNRVVTNIREEVYFHLQSLSLIFTGEFYWYPDYQGLRHGGV